LFSFIRSFSILDTLRQAELDGTWDRRVMRWSVSQLIGTAPPPDTVCNVHLICRVLFSDNSMQAEEAQTLEAYKEARRQRYARHRTSLIDMSYLRP
jgi:hypothetical protein